MPFTLPDSLAARLQEAAAVEAMSPADLVETLLDRHQENRRWRETLRYGRERGAAQGPPPDVSDEDINDLVNKKIAESRRERRDR